MKYVTVYAFSTENWSRPKEEIDTLMGLLRDFLKECIKKSKKNNIISFASLRIFRTATFAPSAFFFTSFTSSFLRSSVSSGNTRCHYFCFH